MSSRLHDGLLPPRDLGPKCPFFTPYQTREYKRLLCSFIKETLLAVTPTPSRVIECAAISVPVGVQTSAGGPIEQSQMQVSQAESKTTATTLVLLPGLDGTEVFFRPLIAALPAWIRPLIVTYPTSGPNGYADLLTVVQRAVADTHDFYVLGWSFSGPLALTLATQEPQRTRGVILVASFVRSPLPLSWFRFSTVQPVVGFIRVVRRLPTWFWADEFRRDKAATWARVSARVLAVRAREILAVDARDSLRACPSPVLYVAGSRDTVVPPRNADEVVSVRPSTQIVTIDGPHFALYTNPQATAYAIATFLQREECRAITRDQAL